MLKQAASLGLIFYLTTAAFVFSQNKKPEVFVKTKTTLSDDDRIPFWMHSNQFGRISREGGLNVLMGLKSTSPLTINPSLKMEYGLAGVGQFSYEGDDAVFVDQAYVSFHLKDKFHLDLGLRHDSIRFDGLSATNGHFVQSNNARSIPSFRAQSDYFKLPFAKKWLSIKGRWQEGIFLDNRYVPNAFLHNKNLYVRARFSPRLNMELGLEHYVQWGGESDSVSNGLDAYLKSILAFGGTESQNERGNANGNHLGTHHFQINHIGNKTNWHAYYSHPFEDSSGLRLASFPDGVFGLFLDFKKPEAAVGKMIFEYYNTKNQRGGKFGFIDNYFSNSIYRSGWRHFGRTIGSPLLTPLNRDGNTIQEVTVNNAFVAYHLGLSGHIMRHLNYRTLLTYSDNFGTVTNSLGKPQFSSSIELDYHANGSPWYLSVGLAQDIGELYKDRFGAFFGIQYRH